MAIGALNLTRDVVDHVQDFVFHGINGGNGRGESCVQFCDSGLDFLYGCFDVSLE